MITNDQKEIIDYVIEYVGNSSDDWFRIKKEIVKLFPPKERSSFSRRHYSTKKHFINDFEIDIMKYWKDKTGVELQVDETMLHPESWKRRPAGWGLAEYNKSRKQNQNKE